MRCRSAPHKKDDMSLTQPRPEVLGSQGSLSGLGVAPSTPRRSRYASRRRLASRPWSNAFRNRAPPTSAKGLFWSGTRSARGQSTNKGLSPTGEGAGADSASFHRRLRVTELARIHAGSKFVSFFLFSPSSGSLERSNKKELADGHHCHLFSPGGGSSAPRAVLRGPGLPRQLPGGRDTLDAGV